MCDGGILTSRVVLRCPDARALHSASYPAQRTTACLHCGIKTNETLSPSTEMHARLDDVMASPAREHALS